mgnify:CR=1 FL=1
MGTKIFGANRGIATSNAIPDNTSNALDIESTDANAEDYITIDTTEGSENMKFGVGASSDMMRFFANGTIDTSQSNGYGIQAKTTATATAPVFIPNKNDPDTGIGRADDDALSLISGNQEGIRITEAGDAITNITCNGPVGIREAAVENHWAGARDLVVKGSNNSGITLRASSSVYSSSIAAADADGTSAEGVGGMLQYVHNGDYWRFYSKWAGTGDYSWRMNEYGVQRQHFSLAENSTALGDETSSNRSAYLDDSGATLIINMALGCAGTVTLTANVTAIKFLYSTEYGAAQNFSLKIKQHSSAAKAVSYSSVTQYVGADGSTAKGTSMLWAGGADHVMSTGTNNIDIVNFTCIPNSDADRVVYASVVGQNFS